VTTRWIALATALAVGCLAGHGTASATGEPIDFQTPSGNIDCNSGAFPVGGFKGRWSLACTVFSEANQHGQKIWQMRPSGRVWVGFVAANVATDVPVLKYGKTWVSHGVRCTSRQSGLTCRNRSGHGFFLSHGSQRVF